MSRTLINFCSTQPCLRHFAHWCFQPWSFGLFFRQVLIQEAGSYGEWATINGSQFSFATVAVFALGILLHAMMHWSWVCGVITTRMARDKKAKLDEGAQTIYGVGLLIVILNILGLAIAVATLMIQRPT
jgi:hypothetical protein